MGDPLETDTYQLCLRFIVPGQLPLKPPRPYIQEIVKWISEHSLISQNIGRIISVGSILDGLVRWDVLLKGTPPIDFIEQLAGEFKSISAEFYYAGRLGSSIYGAGKISTGKVRHDSVDSLEDVPYVRCFVNIEYYCPKHLSRVTPCVRESEVQVASEIQTYIALIPTVDFGPLSPESISIRLGDGEIVTRIRAGKDYEQGIRIINGIIDCFYSGLLERTLVEASQNGIPQVLKFTPRKSRSILRQPLVSK